MNEETVIRDLEAANPVRIPTKKSADAAWSEFRSSVAMPHTGRRRMIGIAGIAAAAVAIALVSSGTWPLGTPPNAAAAQLTKIATAARSQRSTTSLPHQYDYLKTYDSANDISRKMHGKRIYATQSVTSQTWIQILKGGVTRSCRFKQTVGPVKFFGDGERIWKSLGKPSIGARNADLSQRGCGRYEQLGFGVKPPTHLTAATLLSAIRRAAHPSDAEIFLGLVNIYFGATPPSPALRSAILTDLARLKGVIALGPRKDSLGRSGLGFSHAITQPPGCLGNCGRVHYVESIIIDPTTGSLLSMTTNQQGPVSTETIVQHEMVNSIHSPKLSSN
ncbi:MAG TPA: hypothetical protein VIJ40_00775 [Acidimicrobiales bacterium]